MTVVNPDHEDIQTILHQAKRIAVVGLSDKPERTSYQVAKYIHDAGYDIIPVNPNVDQVFGCNAVSKLEDIEGHVDIVNVFRRSEYLLDVAKEALSIDFDVFWAQLGLVNEEAYDFLKEHDKTVIMDRCIKIEHTGL